MNQPTEEPAPTARTDVAGSGPEVVFVPGALTGWLSWQPHAEHFAQRGRRAIRTQLLNVELGLRGEPLPQGYSLRSESQALLSALDDLAVAEADLVGWSYGAAVALDLALDHPERVRTLTLIEPDGDWLLRAHGRYGADAQAFTDLMRSLGSGEVSEDQLERFMIDVGVVPEGVNVRGLPRWPVWVEHRRSLRIGDIPSRHQDEVSRLRAFARPTLLFKGGGSPGFMREIVDLLGRDLPNARVLELPGGHALPMVSQERFLEILGVFLDEHGG